MERDNIKEGMLHSIEFGISLLTALQTVVKEDNEIKPRGLEITASLLEFVVGNIKLSAEILEELNNDG